MTYRLHVREDSHLLCSVCIVILDVCINHNREGRRSMHTVNIKGKIFFELTIYLKPWFLYLNVAWWIWLSDLTSFMDYQVIGLNILDHYSTNNSMYCFMYFFFYAFLKGASYYFSFCPKILVIAQHEWKHVSWWGLRKINFHDCICCCKICIRANTHSHSQCGVAVAWQM